MNAGMTMIYRKCWFVIFTSFFLLMGCENILYPIHRAVKQGDLAEVQSLIETGKGVNDLDGTGVSPLHYAALYGHKDIANLLISKGALIDSRSIREDATPLHMAVSGRHTDIVMLLIEKGANVNAQETMNYATPLHFASGITVNRVCGVKISHPKVEIVKILLSNGADVNAAARHGITPLDLAVKGGYTEIAEVIGGAKYGQRGPHETKN